MVGNISVHLSSEQNAPFLTNSKGFERCQVDVKCMNIMWFISSSEMCVLYSILDKISLKLCSRKEMIQMEPDIWFWIHNYYLLNGSK